MNKDYWDLTDRPHTERKLAALEKYINAWAKIIFSQWRKNHYYKNFKTIYYVDCFAGRGKYHKKGKPNTVDGSPLIALKCAEILQKEFNGEVELRCIFVEEKQKFVKELEKFCQPFKSKVQYSIYPGDINQQIDSIITTVGSNAAFFFVDPCKLSDLDNKTVEKIANKRGGKDIILNYICGTNRVVGAIRKMVSEGRINDKTYKLIHSIEKFHTLPVLEKCLNKSDKEKLRYWATEMFKDTNLEYRAVYEMMSSSKNEPVYYLLFASRNKVARKIMVDILKKEDMVNYDGQQKLLPLDNFDL